MAFTRMALSGGQHSATALEKEREELSGKKQQLLAQFGYPADYLEMRFDCEKCRDTGLLDDGTRCSCFAEKLRQAIEAETR